MATKTDAPARHQFYYTHCVVADSVFEHSGFAVRAASDRAVAKHAQEVPAYLLPDDLSSDQTTPERAPRRLARTPGPAGAVWVVHSAFVEKATMGRKGSHFSHLLLLPAGEATPAAVLATWAATWWKTADDAKIDAKTPLPPAPPLTSGGAVGDDNLAAFLAQAPFRDRSTDLAEVVCPTNLRDKPEERWKLAGRFLAGLVDATQRKQQVFVHAEPGLLAMLLYAAARLLPPGWVGDLTFTTYEPYHRNLRTRGKYDGGKCDVVGTYIGKPDDCFRRDENLLSAGYVLDVFRPDDYSDDLNISTKSFDHLLGLTREDDWPAAVAWFHKSVGNSRPSPARMDELTRIAGPAARLESKKATPDDLLALKGNKDGEPLLAAHSGVVWQVLLEHAAFCPDLRVAFADDLRAAARQDDRWEQLLRAIPADPGRWRKRWELAKTAADGLPETVGAAAGWVFDRLAERNVRLTPADRAGLRADAAGYPDGKADGAFRPADDDDLRAILDTPALPPMRRGQALALALVAEAAAPGSFPSAAPHLVAANQDVVTAILQTTTRLGEKFQLVVLARVADPVPTKFCDHLFRAGTGILRRDDWAALAHRLRDPVWDHRLVEHDWLEILLTELRTHQEAVRLWERFLNKLKPEGLGGTDQEQSNIHEVLAAAHKELDRNRVDIRPELDKRASAKLMCYPKLVPLFADPSNAANWKGEQLERTFSAVGFDGKADGLKSLFAAWFRRHPRKAESRFLKVFDQCFPEQDRLKTWVIVTGACHGTIDETRVQLCYAKRMSCEALRDALDEEPRPRLTDEARAKLKKKIDKWKRKKKWLARLGRPVSEYWAWSLTLLVAVLLGANGLVWLAIDAIGRSPDGGKWLWRLWLGS